MYAVQHSVTMQRPNIRQAHKQHLLMELQQRNPNVEQRRFLESGTTKSVGQNKRGLTACPSLNAPVFGREGGATRVCDIAYHCLRIAMAAPRASATLTHTNQPNLCLTSNPPFAPPPAGQTVPPSRLHWMPIRSSHPQMSPSTCG